MHAFKNISIIFSLLLVFTSINSNPEIIRRFSKMPFLIKSSFPPLIINLNQKEYKFSFSLFSMNFWVKHESDSVINQFFSLKINNSLHLISKKLSSGPSRFWRLTRLLEKMFDRSVIHMKEIRRDGFSLVSSL